MKKYLMCPPDYFRVEYTINPWMKGESVNLALATSQWNSLVDKIEDLGASVVLMDPHPDLPDLVFTANAAIVEKGHAVLSNFRHRVRRPERDANKAWFEKNGYKCSMLPLGTFFEGRGDCFVVGDRLIAASGFRTSKDAPSVVANILGLKVSHVMLKDPRFYHLDTCMTLLDKDINNPLGMYFPDAFHHPDMGGELGMDFVIVSERDACKFACNCIVINRNVILPTGCDDTAMMLTNLGYQCHEVDVSEFLKSGGGPRCLVLEI